MKRLFGLIFLLALFLPGCAAIEGAQKFMKEMGAVQSAVVKLTGHEDTQVVHLNGHILQVVLINSKYNEMESEKKEKATKEIAQTAWDALATHDGIDEVMVVFHIHDKKMGVVEYNNSLDSHTFPVSELTLEATATPDASATPG